VVIWLYLFVLLFSLVILLLLGAPVIFALGTASWIYFIVKPGMSSMISVYVHKFFTGMDSFVLLCIPLFIMAGEIMKKSGMTSDLIKFVQIIVGRVKGGMAYVNVLVSMLFGGMTGSGLADISALGPLEIQAMKEDGYEASFAAALTATSAIQGPIIPPSIPMVVFASVTNTSIGALFLGGAIPGILIGLGQIFVITLLIKKKKFPNHKTETTIKDIINSTKAAIYSLIMPLIVIGGILSGVFTPTEAAAVAVAYSLVISTFVYKKNKISIKDFTEVLTNTVKTTATIYLIIGFSSILSWIFAIEKVPMLIQLIVSKYNPSVYLLLFLVNVFFLFNGMWLSDMVQLLLFAPLFTPIFSQLGVNPVHFGVIMVVNVMIGMITPPYGAALYMVSAVSGEKLRNIAIETIPFTIASIIVLFIITYFPKLVLFLPKMFQLIE